MNEITPKQKTKSIRKKLSVIICTRNRLENLKEALESLEIQVKNREEVEIIVIDNKSSDGTVEWLKNYQKVGNLRFFIEENIGLSHARNRGWREAQGEFICYTDDDAILPLNWINEALSIIIKNEYKIFGGPYYPFYRDDKPYWFKDEYGSSNWLPQKETFLENDYLVGGNMFFKKELLEECGGFPTQFGMSGNKLGYGEETYLQKKILQTHQNIKIFFTPRLCILHLVSKKKQSPYWNIKRYTKQGSDMFHYDYLNASNKYVKLFFAILKSIIFLPILYIVIVIEGTIGLLFRNRNKYPFWQNFIYEKGKRYGRLLGYFCEPFFLFFQMMINL